MVSSNLSKPSPRLIKSRQQQSRELSTVADQKTLAHSSDTPYRLPKINLFSNSFTDVDDGNGYTLWSRHGYDVFQQNPVNLVDVARQYSRTPRQLSLEMRRVTSLAAGHPKFACAAIQPHMPGQPKFYTSTPVDHIYCNRALRQPTTMEQMYPDRAVMPSAVSWKMIFPPNISADQRQLHWMLAPYKNLNFDKTGSGLVQGPYSREFAVHCKAPTTWKKMIWGSKLGSSGIVRRCLPPPPPQQLASSATTVRTPRTAR